jgi:hypothetical protein
MKINNYYSLLLLIHSTHATEFVYDINDTKDIEFIAQFPEYRDTTVYGTRPNVLDASHLVDLNPLVNWDIPETYQFKNPKELYVAKLNNARVSPALIGTIFNQDQQLLFSISWNPQAPIFWADTTKNTKFVKKLATVQGPTFFYHTIIDRMPSILLLRDTVLHNPEVKLLINRQGPIPHYILEYLDLLGINTEQIEPAGFVDMVFAEELYFATPFLMEPIPRTLLLKLRNDLLEASKMRSITRTYNDNLIVVIQRREPDRRIQNLNELIQAINGIFPSNYEVLIFDASQSVAEQIQIFHNAKVIIGLMASGQTNIIYAKPGTAIIDIRPSLSSGPPVKNHNGGREWCWWLSCACDLDYWALSHDFQFSDLWVTCSIESIKQILEQVKINITKRN